MNKTSIPKPLFDISITNIPSNIHDCIGIIDATAESNAIISFLKKYDGNKSTFENYKREIERLCQWSWSIVKKSILELKRQDIEDYIKFCQSPPKSWIGTRKVPRFINKNNQPIPNPAWRPFVVSVSKSDYKHGKASDPAEYVMSQQAIAIIFASLSSFYNHLLQEGIYSNNPVLQIRQKSKFIRTQQSQRTVRRLSNLQWDIVIEVAEEMANDDPTKHERTLFVISALYLLYLRISELVATSRWTPQMGHFYQDSQSNWWLKTVSKGNKERIISVSDGMLKALKRYRLSRGLTPPLPLAGETTPLIHKVLGKGAVTSDRQIRFIVQDCFDKAVQKLSAEGFHDEANQLEEATVHWLRHTGISDDLNKRSRPLPHVRDDAGHSSSAITDRYNDVNLQERHYSARKKDIKE